MRRALFIILAGALVLSPGFGAGCSSGSSMDQPSPMPTVTVTATVTATPVFSLTSDELDTYAVVILQRRHVVRDMQRIRNWMDDFPVGDSKACAKAVDDLFDQRDEWNKLSRTEGNVTQLENSWDRCIQCYTKACLRLARGLANSDLVQLNAIDYWLERGDAALDDTEAEIAEIRNRIGAEPSDEATY